MVESLECNESEIAQAAKDGLAGIPGREADMTALAMLKSPKGDRRLIGIELVTRRPHGRRRSGPGQGGARHGFWTVQALQGLGQLGRVGEVPSVINLLLKRPTHRTCAAAEALSSISGRAGKPEAMTESHRCLRPGAASPKGRPVRCPAFDWRAEALACVRSASSDTNAEVRDAGIRALADWPEEAAAPDLLQIVRSGTNGTQRALAFRGYVRLAREPGAATTTMSEAASVANSADDKKLVLSGLADITSPESLRLVATYVSNPTLTDEAGATR